MTRVAISHRTVRLKRGKIALALRCSARGVGVCKGKLTLQLTAATSRLRDAATGSAGYSIKAGATKALLIKAPSAVVKRVKQKHKAVVKVTIAQASGKNITKLITVVPER